MEETSEEEVVSAFFECENSVDRKLVNACLEIEDVQFINNTSQRFWDLCNFGENNKKTEIENIEYR